MMALREALSLRTVLTEQMIWKIVINHIKKELMLGKSIY